MARAKRSGASGKGEAKGKGMAMPRRIFAQVSPKSVGGVSMFDAMGGINAETVEAFQSEQDDIARACDLLRKAGFEILDDTSSFTINIAGSAGTYRKAFGTDLVVKQRPVIKEFGREDVAEFIECPDTPVPGLIATAGTDFEDVVEGVAIEEKRYMMAPPSIFPPPKGYWHLDVPADVSLAANADRAHRTGITGKGVKVAMVDSGQYKHPFFAARGYRVAPVVLGPAASNPTHDEVGHGTAESANIFSVAPDAQLLPVKISFVNSVGAFNAAVALRPDIITCSWGSSRMNGPLTAADQALAAAVAAAWASGIVVIFSAGNGQWGFPGQHPDVISAGGVFMRQDGSFEASDYASGFMSRIYRNRRVPDLCGLVGMRPGALYIMLPLEPGDSIDRDLAGGTHPNGDETARDDGWAAISGTSAAAPQLAGAAALIKQACGRLGPKDVREILMKTARDVTQGRCHPDHDHPAGPGVDLATGHGLVDAHKAVMLAKVRCLRVGPPISRAAPTRSVRPGPEPIRRIPPPTIPQPPRPPFPPRPPRPVIGPPICPTEGPAGLEQASLEAQLAAEQGAAGLSAEDAEALEQMIIESDLDLGA